MLENLKRKIQIFIIKLNSWEYWPFNVVYLPIIFYWLWLSLKARSILFFSSSNPSIETGGMMGESKAAILKLIPDQYKPLAVYASKNFSFESLLKEIKKAGIKN